MKNLHRTFYVALAGVIWAILGCGGISPDDFDFDIDPGTSCSGDVGDLSGNWVIEGEGSRSSCLRESYNTDDLRISSLSIPIEYDADTEEFVLGGGLPDGFELTNDSINGSCIDFNTSESTGDSEQSIRWEGKFENDTTIEGEFSISGPFRCTGSGTFRMIRQ